MSAEFKGDRQRMANFARSVDWMKTAVQPCLIAIDLGAESCRISLLRWTEDHPEILLVHRFSNQPVRENGSLHWDLRRICQGIEEGLRACADLAPKPVDAIGVDGWAVDYVRLDETGRPLMDPFCYRDERTVAAQQRVHRQISKERLYALTGIQILPLNTLYQLHADEAQDVPQNTPWVNLPEFVLHRLGGRRVAEYTNATHTQMLGIGTRDWCGEIFAAANLELGAAPPVVWPGTDVGCIEGALAKLPSFRNTRLIAPACHDTASAVAGIPLAGNDWAFISSGTWSLVGCVLESPHLSAEAMCSNFSNEGGIGGKINFLKNVNGMWLLQQCLEDWRIQGRAWALDELFGRCEALPSPAFTLNVDDPDLLLPGNMSARINAQLALAELPAVDDDVSMANLILHSLAARYAEIIRDLANITGRQFKRVCVVGGGSRNRLLNRLTEKTTSLEIVVGSSESATIGNFAVQLAALAGDRRNEVGVTSESVAHWAGWLAAAPSVQLEPAVNRLTES